jgi:hypothetical protein
MNEKVLPFVKCDIQAATATVDGYPMNALWFDYYDQIQPIRFGN